MKHTTLEGTRELMRRPEVGVILATGGTGLVRAAYGSGKPAYGVGPGNVPAFIERTADVRKAVADIIAGKTFDYGTICSSEQAIVAEESVRDRALEECRQQGAYFLSETEAEKVAALVFLPGSHTPNTGIVGRAATVIAGMAGIQVPPATRVLIARLDAATGGARVSLIGGEVVADSGVLFGAESCGRDRAVPAAAGVQRAGPHVRDPFAESRGDPGVRRGHAGVSRGGQQRLGAWIDRLLDEPVSGDDAGLRRARRQHHFRQYRPATSDEREAHCVGSARPSSIARCRRISAWREPRLPAAPEAVQEKVNLPAAPAGASGPGAPPAAIEAKPEEATMETTAAHETPCAVDRAAIARVVASVLEAQGIPRGKGGPADGCFRRRIVASACYRKAGPERNAEPGVHRHGNCGSLFCSATKKNELSADAAGATVRPNRSEHRRTRILPLPRRRWARRKKRSRRRRCRSKFRFSSVKMMCAGP